MHTRRSACFRLLVAVGAGFPLLVAAQARGQQPPDSLQRASAAFHAGYAAHQAGNLVQAQAQFAEAARLAPQIPEGHEALGAVLMELGKPAEAIPELESALQLKPGDQEIETNLALAYAKADEPGMAIPHFSAVFEAARKPGQKPVDAVFCEAYARTLAAAGNQAQAIEMFRAALERDSSRLDLVDAIG